DGAIVGGRERAVLIGVGLGKDGNGQELVELGLGPLLAAHRQVLWGRGSEEWRGPRSRPFCQELRDPLLKRQESLLVRAGTGLVGGAGRRAGRRPLCVFVLLQR